MAMFGALPTVKSVNLPMVPLVTCLPMVTEISDANGTMIGNYGTIGRLHGGIFIIFINSLHSFFVFLFSTCILCYL